LTGVLNPSMVAVSDGDGEMIERLIHGGDGTLDLIQYGFKLYEGKNSVVDILIPYKIKLDKSKIIVYQRYVEIERIVYYKYKSKCKAITADVLDNGCYLIIDGHHRLMAKLFSGYSHISVKNY